MELWQLVKLVSERYGRRLQEHRKKSPSDGLHKLSVQQFQYLLAASRIPEATVGRLASYFGVTSPTATFTVGRLVKDGYLAKKHSGDDSRVKILVLTPKGRRLLGIQEEAFRALAEDIRKALTEEELEAYSVLTKKVCDGLID